MHIKSIVLDGFKSYGQRVEINGFDKEFNAITGLNGTGKSNILDSICFVLGITQLTNVRVNSLQDLIFKFGQAGVTKATVTITFDNRNKKLSPVGYQNHDEITVTRQVVMGNKNKYLINGVQVQNKRVQDLFGSVQLNVNNPHFLIMQGRITKVLNMKPPEILSMIEEAAGTRMYESKKISAQRVIEKKELKLIELNRLSEEEVLPKLNRLREERKMYLEFQTLERVLENITSLYSAWQFIQTRKYMQRSLQELEDQRREIETIQTNISQNRQTSEKIDADVAKYQQKDDEHNETLQTIEKDMKEKEKVLAKANAQEKSANDDIRNEERKLKQLELSLKSDEKGLEAKEQEMTDWNKVFQNLKEAEERDSAAFGAAQKKFEAVNAGMEIGDDGEAATLQEQLIKARHNATEAATEVKVATMHLKQNEADLRSKQKEIGNTSTDLRTDQSTVENLQRDVDTLQANLQSLNYDESHAANLQNSRRDLHEECYRLRNQIERMEARYPHINFQYQDPEPRFNRKSVKGLVCKLIALRDKRFATALETVAGGRLFNVITDTELTSKKLLQNGQLQQRTTMIPLNKIKGNPITADTVKLAKSLVGSDNVHSALSVIQYNKELEPAMDYIFGSVFITSDMNTARKIAFNDRIARKCVTLDGDVVDPAGVLTGGAVKSESSFLLQLDEYKDQQQKLQAKEFDLNQTETELNHNRKTAARYQELKNQFDKKSYELAVIKERMQQSTHYQLQEEIENHRRTIAELTQQIKDCNAKEKLELAKAKDIESKIGNSKNYKEKMLKETEAEMKRLKKAAEKSKASWKQKEQDFESLRLGIEELKNAINSDHEQIQICKENLVELNKQYEESNKNAVEAKENFTKAQTAFKDQKSVLAQKNKDIQKKLKNKAELHSQIAEWELEIKKHSLKVKELEEKCKDFKVKEVELKKRHKADENALKTVEKMSEREGQELAKRFTKAQEERNKMSRVVNIKAQSMFDQEEKQYNKIIKRKNIVEMDKRKLLDIIKEMDRKKLDFLKRACDQISKDFGNIFNTLLPGTDAKLYAPENASLLDGLEFKISIGGIWKDNLGELSGGQKSLVALSLILAMLRFKPAPIYILDEVDAALDLSHTQNIGKMLKLYFKHSQFIIVSLKDGMFNNANVLFQTRFENGFSAVSRTENTN